MAAYKACGAGERPVSACLALQIYHDITGNTDSPRDPATSVNAGMRTGLYHVVLANVAASDLPAFYALGAHSYFSESAYTMPEWPARLWGAEQYARLRAIKARVDPDARFGCRHCVGDDAP